MSNFPAKPAYVIGIDLDGDSKSPNEEGAQNAFDGLPSTKYLNFGEQNAGLEFSYQSPVRISGFTITTANDAPERDPASYLLEGNGTAGWQKISDGNLNLSVNRLTESSIISISNASQYKEYRIVFPTVRNPASANSLQFADINLNVASDQEINNPTLLPQQIVGIDLDGDSKSPNGEGAQNAFDGLPSTKYLNFGEQNAGLEFSYQSPVRVSGFTITTANDAPERDPASYLLEGNGAAGWQKISDGNLNLSVNRLTESSVISISNASPYKGYRIVFPTVRNPASADSLQFADINLNVTNDDVQTDDVPTVNLQMASAGAPALAFTGTSAGNFASQGLKTLVGLTSSAVGLYGLQNAAIKITSVDQTGKATVEGSGLWGGKNQTFTGELVKEGNTYSLKSVNGAVDLSRWLGSSAHFQNHSNGKLTLNNTAAVPSFEVEGIAQVLLDPDAASKAAPFTAKLSGFTADQTGIKDFSITPTDLTTPFSVKLGEAILQQGRKALTYRRDVDGKGYIIGLDVSTGGRLTIAGADALEVDGKLLFSGRFGTNDTIRTGATSGSFEIVNTNPFRIANTEFRSIGGLNLTYQEDDLRRNGVIAVNGSSTINLERLKDVAINLGVSGFGLADAMRTASQILAPTLWTLGSIDDRSTAQSFDLGLVAIEDVDLGGLSYLNRSKLSANNSVDLDKSLVESLGGAGLFQVAPLYPTLQDRFTIYDQRGNAISEVLLDISGVAQGSALTTVSRTQQLSNQEKLTIFSAKKAADAKASEGELSISYISDLFTSPNIKSEFDAYTDYFKSASQSSTKYGSVTVDAKGQWTYTLDPAKLDQASKDGLGNPASFRVTPRINIATGLNAELKEIDTSISALFAGVKSQATMALTFLEPISPLVKLMEREVRLTGLKGIDNALLSLLEVVPDNAYKDGKLQVIELLDTASYLQSKGKRSTITPFFKQLGTTIKALESIAGISSIEGSTEVDKLDLGLLFRSDLTPSDPYQWLYSSLVDPAKSQSVVRGEIAKLASDTEELTSLSEKDKAKKAKPNNKTIKGKADKSASASLSASLSVDIPALYEPKKFLASYLTEDLLTLFSLDAKAELEIEGSITIPTGIPLVSAMLGLDASLALGFSLLSVLTADELEVLGEKIDDIQENSKLTESEKVKQIAALVGTAAKEGLGTDLSKNSLEVSLEPYVGLVLGISNYNISGRLGIYFDYELGTERQIISPNGTVKGSDEGVEQRIKFSDYYGERPSGSYTYDPTLGSLRLDLNHNYDFLLAKGTRDTTRFASFEDAYARNSWLLNLQIEPLSLRSLIGSSNVSYDKTLVEKLGNKLIDRIDWISIAGSSLVTPKGVDLFFADAKFLNSPASNALRDAIKRQYSELSDQELGRLLSLIVDYGKPKRVSYALADASAVDARINAMQSVYTVRSASSISAAVAPTDRFRLRYEENGQEAAVDSYLYYGLSQAKYIEIKPKLTTSYASVDFDLISEGSNIELDLHFYDGSSWRPLGNIVDTLNGKPTIRLANGSIESIGLNYKETAKPDPDKYVHNSGTLTLQLALVQMDRPEATADEKLLRDLASRGELQLRLGDSGINSSQVTFMGAPRVERGGAIYTKAVDSGAVLRQAPTTPWPSELASGTVQWLMPAFFKNLAERSDLAFLNHADKATRTAGIVPHLNPQAPLTTQLALQQLEGRSSSHLSASQSGTLASAVEGVMRFTNDPITNQAYKSYIGADGQVRIAARSLDGQDWLDIASLANLQLSRDDNYAPDLVALDSQLVVASWNSAGALVTYLIDTKAPAGNGLREIQPTSTTLARQGTTVDGGNKWISSSSTAKTNKDLQIGLEKRHDLSAGSTSLQKAFYLSLLDPIQQIYATSGQALKLDIEGYNGIANTKGLLDAAQAWTDSTTAQAHLRSLLGFGEKSNQGIFSNKQPGNTLASVRGAAFMEYASTDQLASHLREWGSGSVFVVVGDAEGNAMVWNFDGDAYTRTNANRSKPESVLSSGRVYNLTGVIPAGLSVVYKPTDQKDALVSNWAGLVDADNADYRQVPGSLIRSADLHSRDDLVAGGNVSLLVTGVAKGLTNQVQGGFTSNQLGDDIASRYSYTDGTPILRYFSSERMADANGVYHWYDAGNVAPLQLSQYETSTLTSAQKATASLNSGGTLGGLGWIWTAANPLSRGRLNSLESTSGLGFIDANSLNLAITGTNWNNQLGTGNSVGLEPGSIQLLPTNQTPELFFSGKSGTKALNLSLTAGARSEVGVVLQGDELLNPERLSAERALTASGILKSFFGGDRPFLNRGDYVPLAYYRDGDRIYYGNLQAPVELDVTTSLDPKLFTGLTSQAVTPFGFEGAIADYVTYGVKQPYGAAVLKLTQNMPPTVGSKYFQFVDNNFNPINIGTIMHAPMVPLFGASGSNSRQVIVKDLTPWSPDQSSLYVQNLKDITLGRGEPDPVVLEQMRLVGTYTEAAKSLQDFVSYAWNDSILKYELLDEALPVGPFRTSEEWLTEFRKTYTGIDIPQALDLVSPSYPALVNNTLYSPVAADAVVSSNLPLPFNGPGTTDQLVLNNTIGAGVNIKFGFEAWPFSGTLAALKIPFFKPRTWSVKVNSITSGPLLGEFEVFLDENRNIARDSGELTKQVNQAFYQFDLSSKIDQILLDTSESASTVWDGSKYAVVRQNGLPDFRSGLIITRAASANSVVDVITGLTNNSTYISRADLSIADTHWESVKNSALLDYIPASFSTVSGVGTSRWFDPINADENRKSLSKLVPSTLESAFKGAFRLPSGLTTNFNSVLRVYDALARAATNPSTAPSDLLQQYGFESRIMFTVGLISRLYEQLNIQREQLNSPNAPNGYENEIYAYQVLPNLALTLQGKTDPYYRELLDVVASGVGTPEYAASVSSGLNAGNYKLDLNNSSDIALLLGFARLTIPHSDLGSFDFSDSRLDFSGARTTQLKSLIQGMQLNKRANEFKQYMDAFDSIAAEQYQVNPLLVTTAISDLKTQLLQQDGVLDLLATAVAKSSLDSGVDPTTLDTEFSPLTASQFIDINARIQQRASTSSVPQAVAGLSKAMTVEQTFGQNSPTRFEFLLRLSQPAPSGGAVFLLNYEGSARYGTDYTIDGYLNQPQYIHVAAGDTSRTFIVDVSKATSPSSLLLQLSSGSATYAISNDFNSLLLEIAGSDTGGITSLREQTDNVKLVSQNGISQLFGENLFDGLGRANANSTTRTIGTQPGIKDNHVQISRYISSLDPAIIRLSASQPNNDQISGEWILAAKDIFRAYSKESGLVDIAELRDPKTGRFTYVINNVERRNLVDQGWVDLGIAFSLEPNRSLPIGIESGSQSAGGISVPGFSLAGLSGYFDRYVFAQDQDITEWRFLAEVNKLSFSLGEQSFNLSGSLSLRERREYGDSTFWLAADVDDFILPTLSTNNSSKPVVLNDSDLSFRIFDPAGSEEARINQWQVSGSVSNFDVGPFVLNGSLNARFEQSALTDNRATYWISASVNDFDFTSGNLKLENLDVKLTDLTLVDKKVTAWTIDTSVTALQIVDGLKLSGDLRLTYSENGFQSRFAGQANISSFDINLGSSQVSINNGKIGFGIVDNNLQSWQLSASVQDLAFGGLLKLSGITSLAYDNTGKESSLKGQIELTKAALSLGNDLNIGLEKGIINVDVLNGDLRGFSAQADLVKSSFGLFTLESGNAAIQYQKKLNGITTTERTSFKVDNADISLNLGTGLPKQFLNDVDLTLDIENDNILGFSLAAESVQLDLGNGITVKGGFTLLRETLTTATGLTTRTYGSIEAEEISVALPGLNFKADGFANFTLVDQTLSSINLFAQVNDLKLGTDANPFSLDGFIDLRLSEFIQGAPGKLVLSSGIEDVSLGLPGSAGAKLDGEVKDLTLIPERDSLGQITGVYSPTAWELFGSVEDLSIGGLFTADGYARLAYQKNANTKTENLKGKVDVSRFALTLPGSVNQQTAEISGSAGFDLDYLDNGQSRLNWYELTGGVKGLKLLSGLEISGDISLEYQDKVYSSNSSGKSRYIVNAGIENSSFQITDDIKLVLNDASLSNLIVATDGTVYGWELGTVVTDLDLYGLNLSGDLTLAYDHAARSLSGSAAVKSFKLDLNDDGLSDLPDLEGALQFKLVDNKLSSWALTAKAKNATLFDAFTFDGLIVVKAELSQSAGDRYEVTAAVNDFEVDFGSNNKATLSGELRDLVILDRRDGRPFEEMVQGWNLIASEATLNLGSFSVEGEAEINYGYNANKQREVKIRSQVKNLTLPTTLAAAGTLAGEINATLVDRYGTGSPVLSSWSLSASADALSLAGMQLSGSVKISYSEIDQGTVPRVPYYEIDAQFKDLTIALPENRDLKLDSGRLFIGFFDHGTGSNALSALQNPEKFEVQAKVSNYKVTDQLTLSGAVSLSYANDLYRFSGSVTGLTLPTGKQGESFGGSITDLVVAKSGEVRSWKASAFLEDITLFGNSTLSGNASISYSKEGSNERFMVSAVVDSFGFAVPQLNLDVELSGAISVSTLNGQLERLSVAANLEGLKILEYSLNGELELAYDLRDKLYFGQETIRLERAAVSADVFGGLVTADVEVTNLLIANKNPWTTVRWQAEAAISIGAQADSPLPFALGGKLSVAYEHQNSKYNNTSTYTLSGSIDDFSFNDTFLSVGSVELELDELIFSDGVIRSLDINGRVEDLNLGGIVSLSGELGFQYFEEGGDSTLKIAGNLSELVFGDYDIYKILGIKDASAQATITNGSGIEFIADITLQPDINLSIGDLSFGFEKAGATVRYSTGSNELVLDVNGRFLFGDKNPFPVEGSFSASVDLDDGTLALRNASLLLTPDNQPVDFGLIRLDPGAQLSYANNTLSLSADLSVNAGLLDAAAAPVYKFINTISPAVKPIVNTLSAKMPLDGFKTNAVDVTIPALKIPVVYVSGYKRVFGIQVPTFATRLKTVIPEQKISILPSIDLGSLANSYFENYYGNPYKGNNSVELIEVIDKVASEIFKVNQLLARFGVGSAFEPYVALYGERAYSMPYPALAPFVKTVDSLLNIAKTGSQISNSGWVDLPAVALSYNMANSKFGFEVDGNGDGIAAVLDSLGGFGELYSLVNANPNIPPNQPKPIAQGLSGFIDRSSFTVPIIDNPAKAIFDFILDKNIDLFEYNLDLAAGFQARAEVAIPGETTVPVIGFPLPIVIGGNFGITAGLDATLGFSAPTKGIKAIGAEIADIITNTKEFNLESILSLLIDAGTEPNSGAYLVLDDELVSLDATFSADVGLDYKFAGIRGQLGFGTSLFGGLSLSGADRDYDRLYFNNLLGSIFDPDYGIGKQPADLNLDLKLGNTRVWTDLQFKAASPWMSLLRLESKLPIPKIGASVKLGTIYTGPTFGSAKVLFDQDFDFVLDKAEPFTFSGFREGTANQGDLFSRISSQLLDEDLTGLLVVEPSPDVRDVLTGLSRKISLFDYLSPDDRIPDSLTVISSLQALPYLLREHRSADASSLDLDEIYVNGIQGFAELDITSASSYQGLASDDSEIRDLAIQQLVTEYQLQGLLLATDDYLSSYGIDRLLLEDDYPELPQNSGLLPYLPIALYAASQSKLGSTWLDLTSDQSLKSYFDFVNTLFIANDENLSESSALVSGLLSHLNQEIQTVASAVRSLTAPSLSPAVALVGLKRQMQSGIFADMLLSLHTGASSSQELQDLFESTLQRPGSAQTHVSFADASWSLTDDEARLELSHPASDLGVAISLLVDTSLEYGTDYTINGLDTLPLALSLAAGENTLAVKVDRISSAASAIDAPEIRLVLLQGHSGVQPPVQSNTLLLRADGSASINSTALTASALASLSNLSVIEPDEQGRFSVSPVAGNSHQLLVGFDPLQGHRLVLSDSSLSLDGILQLVNGTLYLDSSPIAHALSPDSSGNWQPLAYVSDAVLRGTTSVTADRATGITLSEDVSGTFSFASLLASIAPGEFGVAAVTTDGNLTVDWNGSESNDTLTIRPVLDFNGVSNLYVSIHESYAQRTIEVPVTVSAVADAPRLIQPLTLTTVEDQPLTLDIRSLEAHFLDPDRFDLVKFEHLSDPSEQPASISIIDHQLEITPPQDFNGERKLQLTVKSDSGLSIFPIRLVVSSVDDRPIGSDRPVLLPSSQLYALTNQEVFHLSDSDSPTFNPTTDGIRITISPYAGELLWKESADAEPQILQIADQRLITLDQLDQGQLMYQHDGVIVDGALINDFFQYVIVQKNQDEWLISDSQTLLLADASKADPNAPAEELISANSVVSTVSSLPPSISNFFVDKQSDLIRFNFSFDQPVQPEGGQIRLYLAADPTEWNSQDQLASFSLTDPAIALSPDGTDLAITLPTSGSHLLQGKAGYLFADLVAQGDVFRSDQGLSLVGDPVFYGTSIDFLGPEIVGHDFISAGSGLTLQLNFSEPVSVSPAATVKIESVHAITGERRFVSSLPVRSTNGSELLVDLSAPLSTLTLMPGQSYALSFDQAASLFDKSGNQPLEPISYPFDLDLPSSPLFAEAMSKALELPATDLHLYFGLRSEGQSSLPISLLGFGTVDPVLSEKPSTLSWYDGVIDCADPLLLSLNLYDSDSIVPTSNTSSIREGLDRVELTLRYNRNEFWISTDQFPEGSLVSQTFVDTDESTGLVDLSLRFNRKSLSWNDQDAFLQLGEIAILPIPNTSDEDASDSFPSLLVHNLQLHYAEAIVAQPETSLPQLTLGKSNLFPNQASEILFLASNTLSLVEDSDSSSGMFEARSPNGFAAGEWLSISALPKRGTVEVDEASSQWTYTPLPDAFGDDSFTLMVRDAAGLEATQTIAISIDNVNDAPSGLPSFRLGNNEGLVLDRAPQQGDILVLDGSAIDDADGLGRLRYQWLAGTQPILGATGQSLRLSQSLVGQSITGVISYTDGDGKVEVIPTSSTAAVLNVNDAPQGKIGILGSPTSVGSILTATLGSLSDLDGLPSSDPADPRFQWSWYAHLSSNESIMLPGQQGHELQLDEDLFTQLLGQRLSVCLTYDGEQDTEPALTSLLTSVVGQPNQPAQGRLRIDGSLQQGAVVRAVVDGLNDPDNQGVTVDPQSLTYQWLVDGQPLPLTTSPSLILTQAHVGQSVSVSASFTDAVGFSETITSSSSVPVRNVNDAPIGSINVSGVPLLPGVLTASVSVFDADNLTAINRTGAVDDESLNYQWLADGQPITAATTHQLVLDSSLLNRRITARAVYTDSFGKTESLLSAPTAPVRSSPPASAPVLLPPLENQVDPDNLGFVLAVPDGSVRVTTLRADRPVTWALRNDGSASDSNLFAVHPSTGILSFVRPASAGGSPDAGYQLGVSATDSYGLTTNGSFQIQVLQSDPSDPDRPLEFSDARLGALVAQFASQDPTDLNADGITDDLQPNVVVSAWGTRANYASDTPASAVAITASAGDSGSSDQSSVHIEGVAVMDTLDVPDSLVSVSSSGTSSTLDVSSVFDPLAFTLASVDPATQLPLDQFIDLAPPIEVDGEGTLDLYPGSQVRTTIDLASGISANAYLKFNPSLNGGTGGWSDFMADNDLETYDNGAQFIDLNGDGLVDRVVLTFTDGDPEGGDMDGVVNGIILDPGVLATVTQRPVITPPAPAGGSMATSESTGAAVVPPSSPPDSSVPADSVADGTVVEHVDADGDGLREAIVTADGYGIDGNRDGVLDAEQAQVAAVRLINDGSKYSDFGALVVSGDVSLRSVRVLPTDPDGSVSIALGGGRFARSILPTGLTNTFAGSLSFELAGLTPGGTAEALIYLPGGYSGDGSAYVRYNYATNRFEDYRDQQGNRLYAFTDTDDDGFADAITLTLTDGDPHWDGDGLVNGSVVDPGFLASGAIEITGDGQNNRLTGNILANQIHGNGKRDVLIGDLGDDILRGGKGNDRLNGGEGADILIGGLGTDRFRYSTLIDSTVERSDTIQFGQRDQIDLRRLDANASRKGNQAFLFVADREFSGEAGELRLFESRLLADVDGDRKADFALNLRSNQAFSADVLLL